MSTKLCCWIRLIPSCSLMRFFWGRRLTFEHKTLKKLISFSLAAFTNLICSFGCEQQKSHWIWFWQYNLNGKTIIHHNCVQKMRCECAVASLFLLPSCAYGTCIMNTLSWMWGCIAAVFPRFCSSLESDHCSNLQGESQRDRKRREGKTHVSALDRSSVCSPDESLGQLPCSDLREEKKYVTV